MHSLNEKDDHALLKTNLHTYKRVMFYFTFILFELSTELILVTFEHLYY